MRRMIVHEREFQASERGFLVDNASWQEEIRRRAAETWTAPILNEAGTGVGGDASEDQPVAVLDPKAAYEEALEKARLEASDMMDRMLRETRDRAEQEAQATLAQAKAEAERLLSEAEAKGRAAAEAARAQAEAAGRVSGLEAGKAEGLSLGKAEGLKEYQLKISAWDQLFRSASEQRRAAVGDLEDVLVDLVGEALHRCLQREAAERPGMVVDLVRSVLKRAQDRTKLRIHLSPDDVQRVNEARSQLQLSVGAGDLELVPDNRIEVGGCLLETEAGSVDARLGTLAAQAQDALKSGM